MDAGKRKAKDELLAASQKNESITKLIEIIKSMKIFYPILFCFIVMWTDSFGQKPVNNFIDYEFNYRIDSLFTICIEKKLLKTENYYIEIYRHSMDTMVFALRAYNPNFPIYDSVGDIIDFTGFLIDKTNRYTLINKKYYPVLTEYDYDFGILKMIGDDEGHQVILRSEFHPLSFYIYTDAYQKVIGIRYQ